MVDFEPIKIKGLNVQYYIVCPRKFWLHSHGIELEQKSDRVLQGKV
ncbi:Dna2/Cas4 domain-containing protein [Priestia megaterium]|nr:Dna2/Cas4 domain-containing protein [Priestia megaterium]